MTYPYIMQGDSITIVVESKAYTINKSHIAFAQLKEAIKNGDWASIPDMLTPTKAIVSYSKGNVRVIDGVLYWKETEMHNSLSARLIQMFSEGFDVDPLVNFMHNLMQNPSNVAIKELYDFLDKASLPITPDGHFIAFKKVEADFKDCHSRTVLFKPASLLTQEDIAFLSTKMGKMHEVQGCVENGLTKIFTERNNVDDDRNNHCSNGLHFCSKDYLNSFGGSKTVMLKINPRDVVSIPSDYDFTKGRACAMYVVDVLDDGTIDEIQNEKTPVQIKPEPKQEFDKWGHPLSMTKDAIRKREKRAAEKAAKACNTNQVPKASVPIKGSTEYIRGYCDGYYNRAARNPGNSQSYLDGFYDGNVDANGGYAPRYEFEVPKDKNGRYLSMTNDAIRKRVKRAEGR